MSFTAHLEYLFHITCDECKFYWTYAAMEKRFDITRRKYNCPNCGHKDTIKLNDEVKWVISSFVNTFNYKSSIFYQLVLYTEQKVLGKLGMKTAE